MDRAKTNILKTSLLGDKLSIKFNIAGSFLLSLRVLEPRWVGVQKEFGYRIDVRIQKRFENDFTYVFNIILIIAEYSHSELLKLRLLLDDLPE